MTSQLRLLHVRSLLILGSMAVTLNAGTICPVVGAANVGSGVNANTGCYVLFTYSNLPSGAITVTRTIDSTVGTYDSPLDGDDITVGVVNNIQAATAPVFVTELDLTSTNPFGNFSGVNIMNFDGDGICAVTPMVSASCPFSANPVWGGYAGPQVTFNVLTPNSGMVFFGGGGIAEGHTDYFGLEAVPNGSQTPEPMASLLMGSGLVFLALRYRKRLL